MRRLPIRGALLAILLGLAAPSAADAAFAETPCTPAGFLCSHVAVPLDRTGVLPGTISLDVHRLPAGVAPTPTALVTLLGGPGQVAGPVTGELAGLLGPVRGPRDLIVFDERGIGGSGALSCPALRSADGSESRQAARCAAELGPARGHYTTPDVVEDIEALRVAGGYDKLTLMGTSYGTKTALAYTAAHPDHVERLILDSVVTPEGPDPLQLSTFQRVGPALDELCSAQRCKHIAPHPVTDVAKLVRRLARRALTANVTSSSGRHLAVQLTPVSLLNVLIAGDLNPAVRAETPAAVVAARRGDGAPLARLRVRSIGVGAVAKLQNPGEGDVNEARFVTTICEEAPFPWDRAAPTTVRARQATAHVDALKPAQFFPFDRETVLSGGLLPLCVRWPDASPAPAPVTLPTTVPALLLSGGQDLRTPEPDAQSVATRLGPGAQLVTVPQVGHSVLGSDPSGCAIAAVLAFLSDAPVAQCGPVKPLLAPVSVPPHAVRGLPPYRGVPGLPGRTLTGASRTIADARRSLVANDIAGLKPRMLGGLRGGTLTVEPVGLRLRHYSFVPGLELTGLVPDATSATLRMTVGGSGAAHGSFTVSGGRIRGRLGGRSINVPTKATTAAARPARRARAPFPRLARLP